MSAWHRWHNEILGAVIAALWLLMLLLETPR